MLYIIHSFASVLRPDSDLHHDVWSISVTLEVLCDTSCCTALDCPLLPSCRCLHTDPPLARHQTMVGTVQSTSFLFNLDNKRTKNLTQPLMSAIGVEVHGHQPSVSRYLVPSFFPGCSFPPFVRPPTDFPTRILWSIMACSSVR